MRDELIDLELAGHVIVDKIRQLRAAFDTTEGAAFPYTAGDELKCYGETHVSMYAQAIMTVIGATYVEY